MILTRISHKISAAAVDPGMSTALRSVGLLDVLSSTLAETSRRAPRSHVRLRRPATKPGEKCGFSHSTTLSGVPLPKTVHRIALKSTVGSLIHKTGPYYLLGEAFVLPLFGRPMDPGASRWLSRDSRAAINFLFPGNHGLSSSCNS